MKTSNIAGRMSIAIGLAAAPALAGDVRLTHSKVDTKVEYGTIAGISDVEPITTHDNTWWRFFRRADFGLTQPVRLTSVRFGVEQASSTAGYQPVVVSLFQVDSAYGDLQMTKIGETVEFIANQTLSLVTVPVDAVLGAQSDLAVAIAPADFGMLGYTGDLFFIGTNSYGETAPSMLSCPSAGNPEPTPYKNIVEGANLAIVMTVYGETVCPGDCDGSGTLDFFDLVCFMDAFTAQDPSADCDDNGVIDMFDLICFQELLAGSCD
jgi:hypothetical protein